MIIKNWILTCVLWSLTLGAVLAQPKIVISGKVTDKANGEVLIGTKVTGNGGEAVVGTNTDGKYSIQLSRKDTIVLRFTYIGYEPVEIKIIKTVATNLVKNIDMKEEGTQSEDVIITAARIEQKKEDLTISVETLNPKKLDNQASTNIMSAMEQTPGVQIMKDQPSIRGSSGYTYGAGSRVITLLDGLPMISANRNSVGFDLLPTDNIRQIEVIKGASSVIFGSGAMGGVINVLTADPTPEPKISIRAKYKVFDNPPLIKWTLKDDNGNPIKDTTISNNWDGRSAAQNPSIHFFYSQKIKSRLDLTTQLDLIKDTGFKQEEFSDRIRAIVMTKLYFPKLPGFYIGLNAQGSWDSSAAFIAWAGFPDSALIPGKGFLTYQYLPRYAIDPSISYLAKNGDHIIYRGRWFYAIDRLSTPQSGTSSLIYNEIQYTKRLGKNITLINGVNYVGTLVKADSVFGKAKGNQYAAYVQAEAKFWDRLNISLGVRYQIEDITGDTAASVEAKGKYPIVKYRTMQEPIFRAGMSFRVLQGSFLRFSIGQGLRSPSVAERFTATAAGTIVVSPNPLIHIEKGYTAEAGIRQLYKFGEYWKGFIDIAAFKMDFKNMVEFYVDNDQFTRFGNLAFNAQNLSRATITGLEVSTVTAGKIGPILLNLTAGVTYMVPEDKNGNPDLNGEDKANEFIQALLVAQFHNRINPNNPVLAPPDNPSFLKYRTKWMSRASLDLTYKRLTFTVNHRYLSHMINIDKVFLVALNGAINFRRYDTNGFNVFDAILAYTQGNSTVSFHVFNIMNELYATLPGAAMGEQRSFAVQYRFLFNPKKKNTEKTEGEKN
ncbi:MAG: TonB-dependent receptor [Bacteroidia bacterium]|nr:TonB-dependent receptor [Bacteroidia bacterium]